MTQPSPDINTVMVDCHRILGQAHSFVGKLEELGALSRKDADAWRKDSDELKDRMKEHITSEIPATEPKGTMPGKLYWFPDGGSTGIKEEAVAAWAKTQTLSNPVSKIMMVWDDDPTKAIAVEITQYAEGSMYPYQVQEPEGRGYDALCFKNARPLTKEELEERTTP